MSHWYDWLAGSTERGLLQVGLQHLAVQQGEVVLEVGFGTGHGILALAKAVGDMGKAHGIDISGGMLSIAQARVSAAGLSHRVELRRDDAISLSFPADWFDAVLMSFTLELFDTPEIPTVLAECRRVLRTHGRIGVVGMSKKGQAGLALRLYEWAHDRFPRYADCRPIFVEQSLEDAGFGILAATQTAMWGLPVEIIVARKVD
jgi:demethylmenaquinone methyltransferase/2-methoxy-6-polyprenyl-1,4-benzoquinol methylase